MELELLSLVSEVRHFGGSLKMKKLLYCSVLFGLSVAVSYANPALHGFCVSPTPTCSDNGIITPVASSLPTFGFWQSSGPATGDDLMVFLIPNDQDPSPGSVSFTLNSTDAGTNDATTVHDSSTLFSTTAWSSGELETFLGIGATPNNPIGAYTPPPTGGDTSATGYYVYEVNLGSTKITPCVGTNCENSAPTFTISGP